jgi:ABC-2 type transport system ATP-binding protein
VSAALSLRGVVKRYRRTVALDGLDLEVPAGSITGLIGPNGAGKTTTFGVVGGLVRPDAGAVDLLGQGPFDPAKHAGRVALLPQDCELNPYTPVEDLIAYFARLQGLGRAEAQGATAAVLEEVDLLERRRSRVGELSHGMRRRVAIAQALVGRPELVLLDEPQSGLDPDLVVRIRAVLRRRAGRVTLLVSSHQLAELEAVCDHVVFLERGRCVRAGPLAELTERQGLVRVEVTGAIDLSALRARLPGLQLELHGALLSAQGPGGLPPEEINRRLLPALIEAGVGVLGVQVGRGLEEAWMRDRQAAG